MRTVTMWPVMSGEDRGLPGKVIEPEGLSEAKAGD